MAGRLTCPGGPRRTKPGAKGSPARSVLLSRGQQLRPRVGQRGPHGGCVRCGRDGLPGAADLAPQHGRVRGRGVPRRASFLPHHVYRSKIVPACVLLCCRHGGKDFCMTHGGGGAFASASAALRVKRPHPCPRLPRGVAARWPPGGLSAGARGKRTLGIWPTLGDVGGGV